MLLINLLIDFLVTLLVTLLVTQALFRLEFLAHAAYRTNIFGFCRGRQALQGAAPLQNGHLDAADATAALL